MTRHVNVPSVGMSQSVIVTTGVSSTHFTGTTTGVDLKSNVYGIDGIFKFKGFSATGEYYWRRRTPETGQAFDSNAGFIQAGMMLNGPRTWEVAFRYGQRDPIASLTDVADQQEIRGALSYYYRRHSLKFQVDGGRVEAGRPNLGPRKDHDIRLQTQFIF